MSEINQDEIGRAVIEARLRELEERQTKFLTEANQTNAAFSGAIQALKDLLNPPAPPEEPVVEGEVVQPQAVEAITA